jgi:hypothetical protein
MAMLGHEDLAALLVADSLESFKRDKPPALAPALYNCLNAVRDFNWIHIGGFLSIVAIYYNDPSMDGQGDRMVFNVAMLASDDIPISDKSSF